jgi:hypothetical protein
MKVTHRGLLIIPSEVLIWPRSATELRQRTRDVSEEIDAVADFATDLVGLLALRGHVAPLLEGAME